MNPLLRPALLALLAVTATARADDRNAQKVIDRAIEAMGGRSNLDKFNAFSASGQGATVLNGEEVPFTFEATINGLRQYRSELELTVGGVAYSAATVIDGDKGWSKRLSTLKLAGKSLADEKRTAYLQLTPIFLASLKGDDYQRELMADGVVDGRPTDVVRLTGPDGESFTAHFDKEGGLMVKLSGKVVSLDGGAVEQDVTFEDYKNFGGVKLATRSTTTRDGRRYLELGELEYQPLDGIEPGTFEEPY